MFDNPHLRAMRNLSRKLRIRFPQRIHPGLQPQHVQLIQDESSVTALGTALFADQPLASVLRRLGKRRVHNLH
jgi:hypothetical protein